MSMYCYGLLFQEIAQLLSSYTPLAALLKQLSSCQVCTSLEAKPYEALCSCIREAIRSYSGSILQQNSNPKAAYQRHLREYLKHTNAQAYSQKFLFNSFQDDVQTSHILFKMPDGSSMQPKLEPILHSSASQTLLYFRTTCGLLELLMPRLQPVPIKA